MLFRSVTCDLIFQPLVLVWKLNCACADTIDTDAVTAVVDPKSKVELSVYCTLPPAHIANTSPVLAFVPLVAVYRYLAPLNDPVESVNRLFGPTIDEATVAVLIWEIPIVNPLEAYDAVAAYDALTAFNT